MDNQLLILLYLAGFIFLESIFLIIVFLMISKTIGFDQLKVFYSAYKKRKKGFMLVRVYGDDLTSRYLLVDKKGGQTLKGKLTRKSNSDSRFALKPSFIYTNEAGLRTQDFFEKDIEPRSPIQNRDFVTNPEAFDNMVQNAVKSEDSIKDLLGYLKHPVVLWVLIGIGVLFAIMAYTIITQNDQMIKLAGQVASSKVIIS